MTLVLKSVLIVLCGYFCYLVTGTTPEAEWRSRYNRYNISLNNHEHIDAIFQRCTGSCNKKYCKIISTCRPFNRTSKIKRLDIYLHDGLKFEAPILFEITTLKKFRTQFRPHMFKYKEDLCKIVLMRHHPFFAFFGIVQTNGTLYDPCPKSGHIFEAPKLTTTWIGTLVPTGEWRIDFNVTKVIDGAEDHILTVSYYILVKAKDAADEF